MKSTSLRGVFFTTKQSAFSKTRLLRSLRSLAMTAFFIVLLMNFTVPPAHASEWAKKEGYWAKTGAKFLFGLKYTLFSFSTPWFESNEPEYKREFEGFATGLGKMFAYEAAGMIHLVTFPIPIDVPDVGIGLHIPNKDCPARHNPNWKPQSKLSPAKSGEAPVSTDTKNPGAPALPPPPAI